MIESAAKNRNSKNIANSLHYGEKYKSNLLYLYLIVYSSSTNKVIKRCYIPPTAEI